MDNSIFRDYLAKFEVVQEATTCLEVLNYTDSSFNSYNEQSLPEACIPDFVHKRGKFSSPKLPDGVKPTSALRLILQADTKDPKSFRSMVISLPISIYDEMMAGMKLPSFTAEATATLGIFFWSRFIDDRDDPRLQIIFRKADARPQKKTKGWELILSHSFRNNETVGFARSKPTPGLRVALKNLPACASEIGHPLLLPSMLLTEFLSPSHEVMHMASRDWLHLVECSISKGISSSRITDPKALQGFNEAMTQLYSSIPLKAPQLSRKVVDRFEAAATCFWDNLKPEQKTPDMKRIQSDLLARLEFFKARLDGIESFGAATMQRLEIQRSAVNLITANIAQRDSQLNLRIAGDQRRLAHASKRDSQAMKGLSLLGALFLPGTFLASIFSMTFFDFQTAPSLSPQIWIYFAFAIPLTGVVVLGWLWWDRARQNRWARKESELDESIKTMEDDVLSGGAAAAGAIPLQHLA
ncbi:hypothetical protein QBC38DRAFT_221177 [Podospora fimiseda]|uniref:Uncharacterized protein n=1 Tax=Podospora fimiseda TaxID=252190 RepID=A0AAN7BNF1_9PEZI|nr:hypothetical protein QBC38DRAFT_221177 [Podospora fimiseda]